MFAVCSGRQLVSLEKLFAPVADMIYFAVDGGSMVFYQGECLYSKFLSKEICDEIIDDAAKIPPCDVMVNGRKHAYACSADSEMYRWMVNSYGYDIQAVGNLKKNVRDEIVKVSLYHLSLIHI